MTALFILLFLMLVGAIIAVETRHLLSAIVCLGAIGFLLAIAFLFLGAPDLAITQLVVETLTLVILIRATIGRDVRTVAGNRERFGMVVTVTMMAVLAVLAAGALDEFPAFGESILDRIPDSPSLTYLRDGRETTGVGNIVTAILLDFRAYDTLGEGTVLFCALMGVLAVLRRTARRCDEDPVCASASKPPMDQERTASGMSLVVKSIARALLGLILLFGLFVVIDGHSSPGGGFAGGVVLACAFILQTLAFGHPSAEFRLNTRTATRLATIGAGAFLLVGLAGVWLGNGFLHNFLPATAWLPGGTITVCELTIGLLVSMGLFAAFRALSSSWRLGAASHRSQPIEREET